MRSNIEIHKKCEWCGNDFVAYKISTRYCSKQCSSYAYKDKIRAHRVKECEAAVADIAPSHETESTPSKEFFTPSQAARLLGISRSTLYRYMADNAIVAVQFKGKTLLRKADIDQLFDSPKPYIKRHKKESAPITEFYTTEEVLAKYGISMAHLYKVEKTVKLPKMLHRGKTLWSKKHIDAHFGKKTYDESITEWCTADDMKARFGMTNSAVYSFVSKFAIPKKKEKGATFYSTRHVELAKGILRQEDVFYTMKEAMEKYDLTRDMIYHYCKRFNIPKKQEGKYVYISKKGLDDVMKPPSL